MEPKPPETLLPHKRDIKSNNVPTTKPQTG